MALSVFTKTSGKNSYKRFTGIASKRIQQQNKEKRRKK